MRMCIRFLAWAHGSFYLTHLKSFARLFTDSSIQDDAAQECLKEYNEIYQLQRLQNDEEIKKQFVY